MPAQRPAGRVPLLAVLAGLGVAGCGGDGTATVTLMPPQGATRTVDFETEEGTEMSVSVAPDGRTLVFDLLAHLYRLPLEGGDAELLTGAAGPALNFHPAFSPDGRRIAFISDRRGQNNVWVMNADGSDPRPVLLDPETRFTSPAWAPDGRSLVAVRAYPTPGRGWHRQTTELWRLPLDGGEPTRLLGGRIMHYDGPAFSADGRSLFFHVSYSTGDGLGLVTAGHRIQRLDLETGQVENVRSGEPAELRPEYVAALRATGYAADVSIDPPAAVMPAPSPDGRRIAFALEEPDSAFAYRGHEFRPRTGLYVRELDTGAERLLLAPITKDLSQINAQYGYRIVPAHAWTPDGRFIVVSGMGKLHRVEVATGAVAPIPFRARVTRTLGEQPRSRPVIDDDGFDVRFIQWPAGSPDGRRLAFVAVGRLWVMDLPGGAPRAVANPVPGAVQLTPAWSPDGLELAFATWHDRDRGHLWRVGPDGTAPVRVSDRAAEYFRPVWSADGRRVIVTMAAGPPSSWNDWNRAQGWEAVSFAREGGAPSVHAAVGALNAVHPLGDGFTFQYQEEPALAAGLYVPYPPESALRQEIRVRVVTPADPRGRDLARFPPRRDRGAEPVVSPDGRWVAYQADKLIFVSELPRAEDSVPFFPTDPGRAVPGRRLVGRIGGAYPTWRDATTLQFASGNRYVTYDVSTGRVTETPVRLRVPRPTPAGSIALAGARIITMDSAGVIEAGTVVVRGARIACVGRCDTTGVDRVLDLRGRTILPGLVDVHAHHTSEPSGVVPPRRPASALDLAYGVTVALDPSASSSAAFPLAEMIDAGVVTGPRTFSTAETIITPGYGFGDHLVLASLDDALYEVGRRADWGAISIKNFRQGRRQQNQWIVEAGRRLGITVTGEGGPLFFDVGLAIDGQTGWEHMIASLPIFDDAAQFFGGAGMVYSPTVIVAGHVHGAKEYFRPSQGLLTDPKYGRFMPRAELLRRHEGARAIPKRDFSFPLVAEGLAAIVRAGGYGAIGEHGEQPGIGSHWEIWAYAEALEPLEALRVATRHGAYFLGLDRELGSLAPGKLADLVVLNANPLANIRNTTDIALVMKGGRLYDDDTLDEIWPDARPFGPIPWR